MIGILREANVPGKGQTDRRNLGISLLNNSAVKVFVEGLEISRFDFTALILADYIYTHTTH